ncbi:MAG: DNA polymerase, partial [Candidatus Omnitrophica bacterium]|nr:DNA polymerase [Candidatus Omnitrophota bacterium]
MTNKTIYLIDGTSICYRSFYAIRLSSSKGLPTGAIYGFYQTLKKIKTQFNPDYMGICFDVSRKTFRQEKFKDYKIQRPPMPDPLKIQIPLIKKLIDAMGITLVEKEGFEADDIIFSLTKKAVAENLETVIVTSDKDIFQLLDEKNVSIYNPTQEKLFRQEDFTKEFGFAPLSIIDFLALAGDSADNIPGAKGIGKAGALKLIKEFKTVENIFSNAVNLSPRMQKIILDNKENILLSKELVKLEACPINTDWKDLKIKESDQEALYKMFSEFEFKSLLKSVAPAALNVQIDLKEGLGCLKSQMDKSEATVFLGAEAAFVFAGDASVCKTTTAAIQSILENERIKKISYDFKEQILQAPDINIKGMWFDVKIAAYVDDPSLLDYELGSLATHYLKDFVSEVPEEAAVYFIQKLYKKLSQNLKEGSLENLFFKVEMPLVRVLSDMETWGVSIDTKNMQELLKDVEGEEEKAAKKIFALAGKEFNLNSPAQLRVVLFEDLKIPPLKATKTGYSTNEEVLVKLADKHVIAKHLLEYRELNKLKTTYIRPLLEMVKLGDGRLHAKFNQTATQTGRLSSSSPNLQSIPARGKFHQALRKTFVSSFEGGYILSGDYSQIELRILAHFSKDKVLIEAFEKNLDIHSFTASLLFGVDEKALEAGMRELAKKVNFGIIYGMSPYGLASELNVRAEEAQNFIDNYFLRYPKVKEYIEKTCSEAETLGYVKTILGRRRNLPDIKSSNMALREFAAR